MKQRKLLALGMATLMAMSSTVMAFATDITEPESATGSASGNGSLEGYVDKEVFTVTLPTTTTLDFTLDPQELLLATSSSSQLDSSALTKGYGAKILFKDSTNFTSKSADITVVNKSTFDVDVTVGAKLTGLSSESDGYDIKVLDPTEESFAFGDETAITMALTPTSNTITGSTPGGSPKSGTPTYLTADAAGVTVTETVEVSSTVDSAYKVTGSTGSYAYAIDPTAAQSVAFNEVIFNLSGTVNTTADWTKFSKAASTALKVEITYSVSKHVDSYASVSSISSASRSVTVNLPSDVTISSVILNKISTGTTVTLNRTTHYTYSSNTLTFESSMISSNSGNTISIKYSDGHTDTISIN